MKTIPITAAGTVLGLRYQQAMNMLMERKLLKRNPKPCVLEEDLVALCQEKGIPYVSTDVVSDVAPVQEAVPEPRAVNPACMVPKKHLLDYLKKDDPTTGRQNTLVNGMVYDEASLDDVLSRGRYTNRVIGGIPKLVFSEFTDPASWRTPEERKWWAVADALVRTAEDPEAEHLNKASFLALQYASVLGLLRLGLQPFSDVDELREKVKNAPWDQVQKYLPDGIVLP